MYIIAAKQRISKLSRKKSSSIKADIKGVYSFTVFRAESRRIRQSPYFFSELDAYLNDSTNPIEEIRRGAENGNPLAVSWMCALSTHDRFKLNRNLERRNSYCRGKNIQKTPLGHFLLGRALFFGRGVDEDREKAVGLIRKSARKGNPFAQNFLGDLLSEGIVVTRNRIEGFNYYMKSAKTGYLPAVHNVALAYSAGKGVMKNNFEAVVWYKKAAARGYPWSQNNLAVHYIKGLGISTNISETVRLINASVRQDNNQGKLLLGRLHETGVGVNIDFKKARALYNEVRQSACDNKLKLVALKSIDRLDSMLE